MRSRLVAACLALTSWALLHGAGLAQDFPSKPIRIYVGQGAGGGMDTLARLVGQRLTVNLGQPVLVENKVGAGASLPATLWPKPPPMAIAC